MTDRGPVLPHLEFTANSTHVDFSLSDVIPTFANSRFALEMTLVTSNKSTEKQILTNYRSFDDEHSPGVFEVKMKRCVKLSTQKRNTLTYKYYYNELHSSFSSL